MKSLQFIVLLILALLYPFFSYSTSYIVKFKSIEKKKDFVLSYSQEYSFRLIDLPISNSIRNFLQGKDLDITQNTQTFLNEFDKFSLIYVDAKETEAELLSKLSSSEIEFFEPNYKVSLDGLATQDNLVKEQWYLDAINVWKAWKTATGKNVLVGIIDTGLDFNNKEFKSRIWVNPKEDNNHNGTFEPWPDTTIINGISGDLNGIDDDGNGFVDDVIGYDFVNQVVGNFGDYDQPDPIPADEHGHGTMVAGVVAAGINDTGIVGVAPEAKLVILRAFDVTGNAEVKDIASAIIYAALNGVKIVNMSFGTHFNSRLLHDAIRFAYSQGCILVASAGNDGEIVEHFPSNYPEVISVGSTTKVGSIGKSSNYGPQVDIFAPGYEILTTTLGNNYKFLSGTSFSAPIVSGAIALMLELKPSLTLDEVRAIMKSTQKLLYKDKKSFGQGIIDVGSAVDFVGSSRVEILSPSEDQTFDKNKTQKISLIYRIFSPFFESFDINLFKNDTVFIKKIIENSKEQKILDSIYLNITNLEIGRYTIQLNLFLKNGNQFNVSKRFILFSSDSSLNLSKSLVVNTFFESFNLPVYVSNLNFPTFCKVMLFSGSQFLASFSDNLVSREHYVPINYQFSNTNLQDYYLIVEHKTSFGTVRYDTVQVGSFAPITQTAFREKFNTLPTAYIFFKPIKLKQFSKLGLLINPYNNLDWSNLEYFEYDDSAFVKRSTFSKAFVPVDIGNSNGNSFDEVLTTSYGQTIVFEPKDPNKFFDNVIFQSKPEETLWGSKFYDLDKDGRDELVCFTDQAIRIYKYDRTYFLANIIAPPDSLGMVGTKPNIQIADFDLDGQVELAFFTTTGYLLIYQFESKFQYFSLEFIQKLDLDPFSISACISKLSQNTGFAISFVGGFNLISNEYNYEYSTIWKLYQVVSKGANNYELKEIGYFWGARIGATPQGIFYRNGINSADIDDSDGDELFLSLFPNLYVMKYDMILDKYLPILWLPFVFSNTVIVEDFDKDGQKEFGVSRWNGLSFYELKVERLPTPINVDGWIDIDDNIYLVWNRVKDANLYQVYEYNRKTNSYNLVLTSKDNQVGFPRSFVNGERIFVVRAIDTLNKMLPSDLSYDIFIYETTLTKPLAIKYANQNQLILQFEGKISINSVPKKELRLFNTDLLEYTILNVGFVNETSLLVSTEIPLNYGNYFIFIDKFRDYWGNYTLPDTIEFEIKNQEQIDSLLVFQRFDFVDNFSFNITFPDELDQNSALNIENYKIIPFGSVAKVEMPKENTVSIQLGTSPNIYSLGKDFYLVLGRIFNRDSSKFIQPPFNTVCITREAKELENAFVYPNPLNLNLLKEITFANIPRNCKVEIYDKNFTKIFEIVNESWRGGIDINLEVTHQNFSSGIYYFRVVREQDGKVITSSLKKFAIVR